MSRKIIDFEAHAQSPEFVKELLHYSGYPHYANDSLGRFTWYQTANTFEVRDKLQPKLEDVTTRLADMDVAGIDVQAVSPSVPNCESFPREMGIKLSRINNDYIRELCSKHPDRFVGLGSLPLQDVDASLEELDRMKSIGLVGIMGVSNVQGEYLNSEKYWPVFERAEKFGFPLFVHPNAPVGIERFTEYHLWGPVFGFGVDVALCTLRMIMGGVFEKHRNFRVVLGHLGETIPFTLRRIDAAYNRTPDALPQIKKRPSEYFLDNIYVDTAGIFHEPALVCTYNSLDHERIVFGSDYPFEKVAPGVEFIEKTEIPEHDKDKIYWQNASKLLGLKV